MERDLKVLIVGARYMVGGKFSTLFYNQEQDLYHFSSAHDRNLFKIKFHEIDNTPGLKNPIFDLNNIPLLIKDYTLEQGDWFDGDFPWWFAMRLFKLSGVTNYEDKASEAVKTKLIYLFWGKSLHWDKDKEFAPELKQQYGASEFEERYRNMLLIEPAESFL